MDHATSPDSVNQEPENDGSLSPATQAENERLRICGLILRYIGDHMDSCIRYGQMLRTIGDEMDAVYMLNRILAQAVVNTDGGPALANTDTVSGQSQTGLLHTNTNHNLQDRPNVANVQLSVIATTNNMNNMQSDEDMPISTDTYPYDQAFNNDPCLDNLNNIDR